jgi:hypothetical protein
MRTSVFAGIALAAATLGGAANAATTINFNDGTAPGFSGSYSFYNSTIPNKAVTVDGTRYLAVPEDGVASGTSLKTATFTSPKAITSFSFDWGTPDAYNVLSFYNGSTLVKSVIGIESNLTKRFTYDFASSANVTSVSFGTTRRAFEIDNLSVTAVPEPASWALMIAGFIMVGAASRRRTRAVAA